MVSTIEDALAAACATDIETVGEAREFAAGLGYVAFRTKLPMPAQFAATPVLCEGFEAGLSDAHCEHEQVRAGLL